MSSLRAAEKWGVRPTEVLMHDEHYGHRTPFSQYISKGDWTDWDYALITALQVIKDHTDSDGLLDWEKDSERVDVMAIKKINRFAAAKERITRRAKYKPDPGEYYIPDLKLMDSSGEWPTRTSWILEKIAESQSE